MIAVNLAEQGAMKRVPHRVEGKLPNARLTRRNGLCRGCHKGIGPEARAYVMDVVDEFVRKNA